MMATMLPQILTQFILLLVLMHQEGFSFRCGGIIFNRQHHHHHYNPHHHELQQQPLHLHLRHPATLVTLSVRRMGNGALMLSMVNPSDMEFGDEYLEPEVMLDDEEPEESFADDDDEDDVADEVEDDVDDEDDDDENDENDEDDTNVGAEKEGLWQERRLTKKEGRERKALALRAKLSWEEKYEDDPLRSDTPAKDFEPEVDGYQHTFVAVGDIVSTTQRQHAWVHHMQWARRTALLPDVDAKVVWEYTRLSPDCMNPAGQVMGIRANSSTVARSLLSSEPLQVAGGVREWQLFEFHPFQHENTTCDLHDPRLFLGFDVDSGGDDDAALLDSHRNYHISGGFTAADHPVTPRVVMMGRLMSCDKHKNTKRGNLVLFNAKTSAESERYMSADPMSGLIDKKQSSISVVNEQDVDGLNHLMARTFGEKTVLDQIHFMDPEDLLAADVDDLPGLEDHQAQNKAALYMMGERNISHKYTRLGVAERYGTQQAEQMAREFNKAVELTQKIRMAPVVDAIDIDEEAVITASTTEEFSTGVTDDGDN